MRIIEAPSPNFEERRNARKPDMLILHYTGMKTAKDALEKMQDPRPDNPKEQVSAHYMIDEDGTIYRLVDESMRAYHAGKSFWDGETDINSASIGIELVNPGHEWGYHPFPSAQMQAVIDLCKDILSRNDIPAWNVLGHSDVAPERKSDPGELFDWKLLADNGIGLWPRPAAGQSSPQDFKSLLVSFGYDPAVSEDILAAAFQQHFNPAAAKAGKIESKENSTLIQALVNSKIRPA